MNTLITFSKSISLETVTGKLALTGILFLFTLISGLIVSSSSRPLSVGLVTIHKLIAVGTVVLIGMTVNQLFKTVEGRVVIEIGVTVISGLLFLALIATGALLTREEMQLPGFILKIHQVAPLLALACSSITIYLLFRGRS